MTVTRDFFECCIHEMLDEWRDGLHCEEACSLLDEQVDGQRARLPDDEAHKRYDMLLRDRTDFEVEAAYWRGHLDCVRLLKRLGVL